MTDLLSEFYILYVSYSKTTCIILYGVIVIYTLSIIYIYNVINKYVKNTNKMKKSIPYFYGEIMKLEDLDREYKQFCLFFHISKENLIHTKNILSNSEMEYIIHNGELTKNLQNIIENSFDKYLSLLPKYISSYFNSNMYGELYLGVTDDGIITGIPYLKKTMKQLNVKRIKEMIYQKFKYIKCINVNDKEILDNIDIELYEVNYQSHLSKLYCKNENSDLHIETYKKRIDEYNKKMQNYRQELRNNWMVFIDKYRIKLETFINDLELRKELIQYMIENNASINLINELKQNKYISMPDGDTIREVKDNNTTIIYWLTHYKDLQIVNLVEKKPQKPYLDLAGIIFPNIMIRRIDILHNKIIENKKNIRNGLTYYLVKIKFNGQNFKDNKYQNMKVKYHSASFKETKASHWVMGYRCIYDNSPYCSYILDD